MERQDCGLRKYGFAWTHLFGVVIAVKSLFFFGVVYGFSVLVSFVFGLCTPTWRETIAARDNGKQPITS